MLRHPAQTEAEAVSVPRPQARRGETNAPLRVWRTFRTGLDVARTKILTIIALALVARFMASQAVDGIATFASTFGLDLDQITEALVFVGSLSVMWFVVVPLAIQAIESPHMKEESRTAVGQTWREVSVHIRALSLRTLLRALGLVLINYALLAGPPSFLVLLQSLNPRSETAEGLAFIGVCLFLVVALVSLRWSVAFPVMVMEDASVKKSLHRSWYLTGSQVVRLLGVNMLTAVVTLVLSALIGLGLFLAFHLLPGSVGGGRSVADPFLFFVGQTLALILVAPVTSACYYYLTNERSD